MGSLANLIAYRFYVTSNHNDKNFPLFTDKFIVMSYISFFLSIGLYFGIHRFR